MSVTYKRSGQAKAFATSSLMGYVSGGPVNNVQQYDLWAEYVVGDEVWVISNWKSEPFPKAQLSRYYKKKLR